MKYIITERQLNLIKESEEKVLYIPTLELFNDDWELLQQFLNKKGNPPYSIGGNLDLSNTNIKSLGNLTSVGGFLDLRETPLSEKYSEKEILQMVNVDGKIMLYP